MRLILLLLPFFAASQDALYLYPYTGIAVGDDMKAKGIGGVGIEHHYGMWVIGMKGDLTVIQESVAGGFAFTGGMQEQKEKWGFGMRLDVGYQDYVDIAGPVVSMGVTAFLKREKAIYRLSPSVANVWGDGNSKGYFVICVESLFKL